MATDPAAWRRTGVLLAGAWREALRVSAGHVEPEHLFLGLLASGGPAARTAAHHGLTLQAARRGAAVSRGRQLRAVGRDVAAEGFVPRAPLAALDRGGAATLPLAPETEALVSGGRRADSELPWALMLIAESEAVAALVRAADADPAALAAALMELDPAPALPGALLPLTPAPCAVPHDALSAPDGILASGAAARRAARSGALGAEWFVSASPAEAFAVLSDPERIRAVLARPQDAEVDDAYGVVTAVSDRARRGTTERTTRQLFPAEPSLDPLLPAGSRRIRWSEVTDRHHHGAVDEQGLPVEDERDVSGLLTGVYDLTLIPDDAPRADAPVDYPGHAHAAQGGTRVRLVHVHRTWGRREALAARAGRWPASWALAQHLQALSALAADDL